MKEMENLIRQSDALETYAELYDIFDDNKAIQEELHKVFDKLNNISVVKSQQEIYRIVLDDLLKENIYRGVYDAKKGDSSCMYGIFLVMSYIADRAGKDVLYDFEDEFFTNIMKSEREAEQRERN